jgi:hypothetical protein
MPTPRRIAIGAAGGFLALVIVAETISPVQSESAPDSPSGYVFPYLPLWPFPDQASADRWLSEQSPTGDSADDSTGDSAGDSTGDSTWHSDAAATAGKFTREFLGFTDLDRVTMVKADAREAWVAVGQSDPNGQPLTAARLHLVRMGPADNAPWEVVGTEDTDLTLDTPAYGSPVRPVIEVGGTISGVDESLEIQARQSSGVLGEFCCVPAGGQGSRWSATVPVSGAQPGAVTVVVSTGGHLFPIERFAITGLLMN